MSALDDFEFVPNAEKQRQDIEAAIVRLCPVLKDFDQKRAAWTQAVQTVMISGNVRELRAAVAHVLANTEEIAMLGALYHRAYADVAATMAPRVIRIRTDRSLEELAATFGLKAGGS